MLSVNFPLIHVNFPRNSHRNRQSRRIALAGQVQGNSAEGSITIAAEEDRGIAMTGRVQEGSAEGSITIATEEI